MQMCSMEMFIKFLRTAIADYVAQQTDELGHQKWEVSNWLAMMAAELRGLAAYAESLDQRGTATAGQVRETRLPRQP
jgi:hypothetical protein